MLLLFARIFSRYGPVFFLSRFRVKFRSPKHGINNASPYEPIGRGGTLETIGQNYRPSKRNHDYLRHYETHLGQIRTTVRNVLEIGVQTDSSLLMWEEFFPNATIWGIDIDPECAEFSGGRRQVRIGNQSDEDFLRAVAAEVLDHGGVDVVIDDGSHRVNHQLISFEVLFPLMNSHGIYVVEDTGGVVGDRSNLVMRSLVDLTSGIFSWPKNVEPKNWPYVTKLDSDSSWWDQNVTGIAVYRWLVFVMRGRNPEDNHYLSRRG